MRQYRITAADLNQDSPDDCYLAPNDPIQELKILSGMGGLGGEARLHEYRAQQGSNISVTGSELGRIQREQNIQPGTPEWFKLWFSLPKFMNGEKAVGQGWRGTNNEN
jgi:hypothetical protein